MDQYTSVIAALNAGKLPSQKQTNAAIDFILKSPLIQIESAPSDAKLSEHGKATATALRDILDAYKQLGTNKNGDDQLQEAIWNLSQGDLTGKTKPSNTAGSTSSDAEALSSAIRTIINVSLANITSEGSSVLGDFASFSRLVAADSAESIEQRARQAKDSLRDVDKEVQEGQRDALGRKGANDDSTNDDTRATFEQNMNTARDVGSKVIGTSQEAKSTANDLSDKSRTAIQESFDKTIDRTKDDQSYHDAISTIFDLSHKWISRSLDTATTDDSLDSFIDDPTGRVPAALTQLRTLLERLAGGKPLTDLISAFRACARDVRADPDLRQFFDDYFSYVRKNLDEPGYSSSDERQRAADDLEKRWQGIMYEDSEREWKRDLDALRREFDEFRELVRADPDVARLKEAHGNLAEEVTEVASAVADASVDRTSWLWHDVLDVYVPRILSQIKDIPVPRTEYTDPEVDFVIEDLDISSLRLLPGHAHISTTSDIDVSQSSAGTKPDTSFSARTRIQFQGVQLTLREVSFYYHDKSKSGGGVAPSEYTGLLDVTLPEKGIDVDLSLSLIPTPNTTERAQCEGFFKLEHTTVTISPDIALAVRKSNHPILVSVFKPIVKKRFRASLEKAVEEQIGMAVRFAGRVAWETHCRARVFRDGGAPAGAAYIGGLWSELGRLGKEPGLFSGWNASVGGGAGVVKDDPRTDTAFAMGAEPQILSGDKHGPAGNFSDKRSDGEGGTTGGLKGGKGALLRETRTLQQTVEAKSEEEGRRKGWRSEAFDGLAVAPGGGGGRLGLAGANSQKTD